MYYSFRHRYKHTLCPDPCNAKLNNVNFLTTATNNFKWVKIYDCKIYHAAIGVFDMKGAKL